MDLGLTIGTPLTAEVDQLGFAVEREKYNLQEFEIAYDSAKFYVIKSYSEDDVHKCIKYDVWSSTPNGNKKLDAAFREADAKMRESGKKCPVFLFFSVSLHSLYPMLLYDLITCHLSSYNHVLCSLELIFSFIH